MGLAITQVDAFADKPFTGNPAAVCILETPQDAEWMQLIAREMNLSETAFLVRREAGYDLRWFTPAVEVDLCGHATLASAHVLWESGGLAPTETARFHTKSGILTARSNGAWIEMDFPAFSVRADATLNREEIESALGTKVKSVWRSRFDCLAELESEYAVRALRPDVTKIRGLKTRGLILTSAASDKNCDYVSRFFAPAVGVDEDPVTGSAHCCLGPYWKERLGRDNLVGYQASARGGFVRTRCDADRVFISGQAITMLRGELVESGAFVSVGSGQR